jgi:hypothetical protein
VVGSEAETAATRRRQPRQYWRVQVFIVVEGMAQGNDRVEEM